MAMCGRCGKRESKITFSDGNDSERICQRCFNKMVAENIGVELKDIPNVISHLDSEGIRRIFRVQYRLYHNGIYIEATENRERGYKFVVHDSLDVDQSKLFDRLMEKVRTGLAKKYVKKGQFPNGQEYLSLAEHDVVGEVCYKKPEASGPDVIIDGKLYTWEQVGEMAGSFEGFQMRMEFLEPGDE